MLNIIKDLFKKKINSVEDILRYPDGKRYYKNQHSIHKGLIDLDALKIIHRLTRYGYKSYIVGGSIRDLLMGKKPKDFDIVTSATPNQIKRVFNNCRIIGRRFKIVHIIFKNKIIEVSTFRSIPKHRLMTKVLDKDYLIKQDNHFGTPKEDSARRDFTINALYFDPRNESIIDYVGGYEDIQSKTLKVIGNEDISFKEDPVRMLRAVKFSVMLGLTIDKETKKSIKKNRHHLEKASKSRMWEEYNKIFRTWKTNEIFRGMVQNYIFEVLFKEVYESQKKKYPLWPENYEESGIGKRLNLADKLLSEREEMTPDIFYALLFSDLIKYNKKDSENNHHSSIKSSLKGIFKRLEVPNKDQEKIIKIFLSQPTFAKANEMNEEQVANFRKKDYYYDTFMVYKINALIENNEEAIQAAFFWEINQRNKPFTHKKNSQRRFHKGGGHRDHHHRERFPKKKE